MGPGPPGAGRNEQGGWPRTMRLAWLLIVTALFEAATGLLLLVWPALILALLFDWRQPAPETLVMGRVAGAGALSIGVASWAATRDALRPAPLGVLAGVLTYNAVGAAVLVFAGTVWSMAGVLLWPAVAYHVAMAACSGARLLILVGGTRPVRSPRL